MFRVEFFKTEANVFIYYPTPEVKFLIRNNTVNIFDYDYNTNIQEIENSESRGYLYTRDCHCTSKFICLFFKKENLVSILFIFRKNPEIRKTVQIFGYYLFESYDSEFIIFESSKNGKNFNEGKHLRIIKLSDNEELSISILRSNECNQKIIKLLDMDEENLLVLKSGESTFNHYLVILSFKDHNNVKSIFTLPYSHPCVSRLYRHYLITMSLSNGWLQIRDTTLHNENNTIYSQKFEDAIAETLIVKYGRIIFCEREKVIVLFTKTIEEEYYRTGMIVNKCTKLLKSNNDLLSRSIKFNSCGFVENIRTTASEIWLNICDGIVREQFYLKFW